MSQQIYSSPLKDVPVPTTSVFSFLNLPGPDFFGDSFPTSAPAYIDALSGAYITRAQTRDLSLRFAHGLKFHPEINAKRGDVVLIYSQNSLCWPIVLFGSVAAGLKCTLANSAYTPQELAFQYQDSHACFVLASEEGIPTVHEMFKSIGIQPAEARRRIIVLESGLEWAGGPPMPRSIQAKGLKTFQELLKLGQLPQEERFDGPDAHETIYLCYSSGTTGKPKGVETTHHNVITILQIVKAVFPRLVSGQDNVLGVLPFFHIYGAIKLLHFPWACGIPLVIMPRFEPEKFFTAIERYSVTIAFVVPPIMLVMAQHPAVGKYDLSSLKILFSGAAPLSISLVDKMNKRLRAKGHDSVVVLQGYGLTETSPTTHLLPLPDAERKIGSIGVLLPNLEARIVVDGDGNGDVDAKQGEPGELWIRGSSIMKGYLNNPTATKDAITPDRWFKTGDIAVRDSEGYYYIVDRRKELIKYKGFQVPPAELEALLITHPDVADAAVIGVYSDKEETELPRAYIVPANPESVKTASARSAFEQGVAKWTQERVARHKFLRGGVIAVEIVPKSASGKILRRELRERAKAEPARKDPSDEVARAKL